MSDEKALVIADVEIVQDANGRYSLNTLHRASGGKGGKRPSIWLGNESTQDLVRELSSQGIQDAVSVKRGGNAAGIYAHKILAESYYDWLIKLSHTKIVTRGFVYVIQYNEKFPFKIGWSKNPNRRLNSIQYTCPVPLSFRCLWEVDQPSILEKLLHDKFSYVRVHGEWFALSGKDEAALIKIMAEVPGVIIHKISSPSLTGATK